MWQAIKKAIEKDSSFFLMAPAVVWQALFFMIPLVLVVSLSFFLECEHSLFSQLSLQNFKTILLWPQFCIIVRSLVLASVTAFGTLLFAYPAAYFIAQHVVKFKTFFIFLLSIPFLINLLVQVYSWYFILEKYGVLNKTLQSLGLIHESQDLLSGKFAVFLVMFHVYLPFMLMPIYSILEKLDKRYIEASSDLGASWFETFTHVILPLSMPGIRSGFFLVLVTSFGEYVIPALLGGMKQFYVGTLISEYFFIGKEWHVGAAFIVFSCICLLVTIAVYNWLFNKITLRSRNI